MELDLNMNELLSTSEEILISVEKRWPKRIQRFMKREAKDVTKEAKKVAKERLKTMRKAKDKKSYMAGFKEGKVYHHLDDPKDFSIRSYNKAPHAHLIETGHVMKVGNEHGTKQKKSEVHVAKGTTQFVPGKFILAKAQQKSSRDFEQHAGEFVDQLLNEGLY